MTKRRASAPAGEPDWRLPSRNVRILGAVIAVVTVLFAVGTFYGAFADDASGADMVLRIGVSVVLAVIALVIGALSLAPAQVRRLLAR
jgi:Zn-dependent protease